MGGFELSRKLGRLEESEGKWILKGHPVAFPPSALSAKVGNPVGETQSAGISAYQKCLGFVLTISHVIKEVLSLRKFQYFTMCFPSESSQKIRILTFFFFFFFPMEREIPNNPR